MRRLTPKQESFVEAYLRLQNGTRAYREAYDKTGTMTDKVAGAAAARLLGKVKVQEALKARKEALQAINAVCTVEELAEGWSDEIRLDLGDLVDEHGTFRNPRDLPRKIRHLVKGVKIKEAIVEQDGGASTVLNRWIEYILPDRQKSRIELGKRIGFYPAERREITGPNGGPIQVAKMTDFPPEPKTLAEWEMQRAEADKQRKALEESE